MAFSVTPSVDNFTLNEGESVDVTYTFADVPTDVTSQGTETFGVGASQIIVALTVTMVAPSPVSVGHTMPAGITRTLLSVDDTQAVVRYSRP